MYSCMERSQIILMKKKQFGASVPNNKAEWPSTMAKQNESDARACALRHTVCICTCSYVLYI